MVLEGEDGQDEEKVSMRGRGERLLKKGPHALRPALGLRKEMDLSGTVASRPILLGTVSAYFSNLGSLVILHQKAILQEAQLLPLAASCPGL